MKILYELIKILLATALLASIFVTASFISKAFHVDGLVALLIVVIFLKIFDFLGVNL